ARPCQGRGRGFESLRPLQFSCHAVRVAHPMLDRVLRRLPAFNPAWGCGIVVAAQSGSSMTIARRAMMLGVALAGFGCFGATGVRAEGPPEGRRIALRGYDPVAYFADGQPARGSREHWYAFDD